MISKSNPNVSHWSMESGYERQFGKEEYPIRVNGSDHMSTLEINLVSDKRNVNYFCPISYKGFNVFLSPPFDQTTLFQRSIGVPLSQDTHIHFAPELTTTSNGLRKYSPIQRKCFFQSERQLRYFKTYSSNNCEMECWANIMKERLGCVHFLMPSMLFFRSNFNFRTENEHFQEIETQKFVVQIWFIFMKLRCISVRWSWNVIVCQHVRLWITTLKWNNLHSMSFRAKSWMKGELRSID